MHVNCSFLLTTFASGQAAFPDITVKAHYLCSITSTILCSLALWRSHYGIPRFRSDQNAGL